MQKYLQYLKMKKVWIPLAALIAVIVVVFVVVKPFNRKPPQAETVQPLQTTVAYRGDLTIFSSGTGSIVPVVQTDLAFDESGTLTEILVSVGDNVKAGDVVARLQTNESAESVEATITEANLAVVQAEKALKELYTEAGSSRAGVLTDIVTYATNVKDAEYNLNYYLLSSPTTASEVLDALDAAKDKYDAAWEAFSPYKFKPREDAQRKAHLEALSTALSDYETALKQLDYEYALQIADASLTSAREKAKNYEDGKPNADDVAVAEATLANAKAKLAKARKGQSVVELKATVDGTILSIDTNVGAYVDKDPVISVVDVSRPLLEVYLDETDLDKIALGYKATVVFDAYPDETFSGTVVEVKPMLETVSNVTAVVGKVELDADSFAKPQTLPIGLNAAIEVIGGETKDAVLVPVEALRTLDKDEYGVFVQEGGELKFRTVEVGLMDFTTAEIKSGLEAGEVVSTGLVPTN